MISASLVRALMAHVPAVAPGLLLYAPLDVILADTVIVQPDVVYLAPDRLHRISRRGIEGPPTLAVEALGLRGDRYVLVAGATGGHAVDLPPFTGLGLVADALWP
jgi:hypothetical protein